MAAMRCQLRTGMPSSSRHAPALPVVACSRSACSTSDRVCSSPRRSFSSVIRRSWPADNIHLRGITCTSDAPREGAWAFSRHSTPGARTVQLEPGFAPQVMFLRHGRRLLARPTARLDCSWCLLQACGHAQKRRECHLASWCNTWSYRLIVVREGKRNLRGRVGGA